MQSHTAADQRRALENTQGSVKRPDPDEGGEDPDRALGQRWRQKPSGQLLQRGSGCVSASGPSPTGPIGRDRTTRRPSRRTPEQCRVARSEVSVRDREDEERPQDHGVEHALDDERGEGLGDRDRLDPREAVGSRELPEPCRKHVVRHKAEHELSLPWKPLADRANREVSVEPGKPGSRRTCQRNARKRNGTVATTTIAARSQTSAARSSASTAEAETSRQHPGQQRDRDNQAEQGLEAVGLQHAAFRFTWANPPPPAALERSAAQTFRKRSAPRSRSLSSLARRARCRRRPNGLRSSGRCSAPRLPGSPRPAPRSRR